MRQLYTLLLYLSTPYILTRLYWKGRKNPAYRKRIAERFGCNDVPSVDVWLHAASLGEVVAATPLIDGLLAKNRRVLVTTMTPAGSQQVLRHFGEKVAHQYVPYDFPIILKRFFKRIGARIGIIMETELWPNLIFEAKKSGLSLILANARISDAAFQQYNKLPFFFAPILKQFNMILAQSELDAERFCALGATRDIVKTLGNMKFDLKVKSINREAFKPLREQWGGARPTLLAASTHEGEEELLLAHLLRLKKRIPGLMLLIAPRHSERFQRVYELCQRHNFITGLRSQPETINASLDVLVLDSMGELLNFFAISDYAFIGGSLVPIGGHNVLEPIALQVPTFCGPYMHNSKSICDDLCQAHALFRAKDINDLVDGISTMHAHSKMRDEQVEQATKVFKANQGTVAKHIQCIETVA